MSLTPETLTRHELNGLPARVVDAANPDLVGVAGRVAIETQQTLHLDDGSRVRQVPKRGTTFEFELRSAEELGDAPAGSGSVGTRGSGETARTDDAAGGERPAATDDAADGERPAATDDAAGGTRPAATDTDEAAEDREASGSALERESETPGVRPGQSGSTHDGSRDASGASRDCEGAVYVTVDGTRLLSRPAHRTEVTGDSQWR
jgi:ribonuclease P protein subunit POP4